MKTSLAIITLLGALALAARAQDAGGPPSDDQNQNGGGMNHRRPPMPPIVLALDANHDGVIDSNEIANASVALKTLDKNGDGKLTRDEYLGKRPSPQNGQAGGPPNDQQGPPPQN